MKKLIFIVIIAVAAWFIYKRINKKTTSTNITLNPATLTPEQQQQAVVNIIKNNPDWVAYIQGEIDKGIMVEKKQNTTFWIMDVMSFGTQDHYAPIYWVPLDDMITREAKRHLRLRGFADIQAHPGDWAKYPRGNTHYEDWMNGY